MLVAIRSRIEGAELRRVCVVVGSIPYAPSGRGVIAPGETSALIEVWPAAAGQRGAVYFELSGAARTIPLMTGELFAVTPGVVLEITIGDDTQAHNAPVEVEGAVARLALARPRR
jgi:hypothetical protein